ncbi:MAG: hypothetical protein J7J86_06305, partial [Bacteroidales bacterium]|nr:hypothetical protein [Bacteroidales bacterium]
MKKFTIGILLLLIVTTSFAQKKWVSFNNQKQQPRVIVQEQNQSHLILNINISGVYMSNINVKGLKYQKLELTEGISTNDIGKPELPMINELIGIPADKKVKINILESKKSSLKNYLVYPYQIPEKDIKNGKSKIFSIDKNFYTGNTSYPPNNFNIEKPGIWRDVKVAALHICPFTYNPSKKELEVYTNLKIEIVFYGTDNINNKIRSKNITPSFYQMYKSAIINFESLGYNKTYSYDSGIKYLIITNTGAYGPIQPFVNWKKQQGFKVEVKTLTNGFNTPQEFKDYITQLYNSDGLEYVLMVGDAYPNGGNNGGPDDVPMYWWEPSGEDGSYSDSWYTCIDDGDDHYADLAIGRIVYDDMDELNLQIQKTLDYYQNPDLSSNWAENSLLVAHKQEYPGKYTQCKESIRTFNYALQSPVFTTCYGGEGKSNSDIVNFVNTSSCGIFNYRGHGSATEFWEWCNSGSFTKSDIDQFTNQNKLLVVFDVCCDNMDIVAYPGDCLCESFMKSPVAAVAINGAIIPSYTVPNHDYDKEMYKALFNEGIYNLGYITNFANAFVLDNHGTMGRSNVRTYLWLGDASIEPWTLHPSELNVTHEPVIPLGSQEFEVIVSGNGPIENARVCISNTSGSVYGVAFTGASGHAVVQFQQPIQTVGNVKLTVTYHNYLPHIEDILVSGAPTPAINPYPMNGQNKVSPFTSLNWQAGIGGIPSSYTLYFGTDNPPSNIVNNLSLTDTFYIPTSSLDYYTQYFWRVDSHNEYGDITGNIWNFTVIYPPDEGFETGDFSANNWYFNGDADWTIDNATAFQGLYSAKSGAISDNQSSSLIIDCTSPSFNNVSFWYKISSEQDSDKLIFYIDGNIKAEWSGEIDWSYKKIAVPPGTHNLEWKYIKNATNSVGDDCAWIDNVYLPVEHSMLTVNAGEDDIICEGSSYTLSGTSENSISVNWTTSGDGTFDDSTDPNATYTPGVNDIETGSVTLTLAASNLQGNTITDDMILAIIPAATVYAGNDTSICEGLSFYIVNSTATNYSSIAWTTSGDGVFNDTSLLNPSYTPGEQDIINGSAQLNVLASGFEPCSDVSDSLILSFDLLPAIPEKPQGPDTVDLAYTNTSEYFINGAANATSYSWMLLPEEAGVLIPDSVQSTVNWNGGFSGIASLKVKALNNCGESMFSDSLNILVENTVGINKYSNSNINIYPNPNNGSFNLKINSKKKDFINLKIFNSLGQIIVEEKNIIIDGNYYKTIN